MTTDRAEKAMMEASMNGMSSVCDGTVNRMTIDRMGINKVRKKTCLSRQEVFLSVDNKIGATVVISVDSSLQWSALMMFDA